VTFGGLRFRKVIDTNMVRERPKRPENITKGKGKAIPLQTWTGPKGSRRFRLPHFKTIGT
jgi:hypothetical protein